jgi:hypothetical protein
MRLAELERHEVLRIAAGVDDLLDPLEHLDDARIGKRQLAGEELLVVVRTQLAQQRFDGEIRPRIRPVADALRDRRHSRRRALSSRDRGTAPASAGRWRAA